MREARIICPTHRNDGEGLGPIIWDLEDWLADVFGGFTRTYGLGGWKGQRESVWIYDIAMQDTPDNNVALHDIAKWLAMAADQEAVYLRHPDGVVRFVTGA